MDEINVQQACKIARDYFIMVFGTKTILFDVKEAWYNKIDDIWGLTVEAGLIFTPVGRYTLGIDNNGNITSINKTEEKEETIVSIKKHDFIWSEKKKGEFIGTVTGAVLVSVSNSKHVWTLRDLFEITGVENGDKVKITVEEID